MRGDCWSATAGCAFSGPAGLIVCAAGNFPLAADPLPSWNDTAAKKAIVAFVEKVSKDNPLQSEACGIALYRDARAVLLRNLRNATCVTRFA